MIKGAPEVVRLHEKCLKNNTDISDFLQTIPHAQ